MCILRRHYRQDDYSSVVVVVVVVMTTVVALCANASRDGDVSCTTNKKYVINNPSSYKTSPATRFINNQWRIQKFITQPSLQEAALHSVCVSVCLVHLVSVHNSEMRRLLMVWIRVNSSK